LIKHGMLRYCLRRSTHDNFFLHVVIYY